MSKKTAETDLSEIEKLKAEIAALKKAKSGGPCPVCGVDQATLGKNDA